MGLYLRYTCDVCAAKKEELPTEGYFSTARPEGWYRLDGRDLCSLSCVAAYAVDPGSTLAMAWRPDPMSEWVKRATGNIT